MKVPSSTSRDAPRFDLIVERSAAKLRLRTAIDAEYVRISRMEAECELSSGPLVLRGDVRRFRTRQTQLRSLRVEVKANALSVHAHELGVALFVDSMGMFEGKPFVHLSVQDEVGTLFVAFDIIPMFRDLLFRIRALDAFDGSLSALRRLRRVGQKLGIPFDGEHDVFRWRDPVRSLLLRALTPHGWRVPDARGANLQLQEMPSGLALLGEWEGVEDAQTSPSLEMSLGSSVSKVPPSTRFFVALESANSAVEAYLDAASKMQHSAWLQAEAYERALDIVPIGHPDRGAFAAFALSRFPDSQMDARRLLDRLVAEHDPAALELADAILAGPLPRVSRGELAARAVVGVLHGTGFGRDRTRGWLRVAFERLKSLSEAARRLAPEAPHSIAASAHCLQIDGDLDGAARAFVEAADRLSSDQSKLAGTWRLRAARLIRRYQGSGPAEVVLRRARLELGDEPELLVELAETLADIGREDEAEETYGLLLRDGGRRGSTSPAHREALLSAARHHTERGNPHRARAFLTAAGEPMLGFSTTSPGQLLLPSLSEEIALSEEFARGDDEEDRNRPSTSVRETSESSGGFSREIDPDDFGDHLESGEYVFASESDVESDELSLEVAKDTSGSQAPPPLPSEPSSSSPKTRIFSAGAGPRSDLSESGELSIDESSPLVPETEDVRSQSEQSQDAGLLEDEFEIESDAHQRPLFDPTSTHSTVMSRGDTSYPPPPPAPQVTLVSVADDELRELLSIARECAEPGAFLEGALEGVYQEGDARGVERILAVLDRIEPFDGQEALAAKADKLLSLLRP